MFRKIVSNLPFSPALVGQLGLFAKKLRKELRIRQIGFYLVILMLILQSLIVFSPAEQANAGSSSNIIAGGVQSTQDIINIYNAGANGQNDFKDVIDYLGITPSDLSSLSNTTTRLCTSDAGSTISFSRQHQFSASDGELSYAVPKKNGGATTIYSAPIGLYNNDHNKNTCFDVFIGNSSKGWFAISKTNGNIFFKQQPALIKGHFTSASCKTIQGYAYDSAKPDQNIKVYLYVGLPGKGKQYGPIIADQANPSSPINGNHGFSFSTQDTIQSAEIWGAIEPSKGWDGANIQFDNTITTPSNCTDQQTTQTNVLPVCSEIQINHLDKNNITIEAAASTNNTSLQGYQFIITDKNGKQIYNKTIPSSSMRILSDPTYLPASGDYSIKVVIKTSSGDKDCGSLTTSTQTNKCVFNPSIASTDTVCQPCPFKNGIWINDPACVQNLTLSKEAKNLTQSSYEANKTLAGASDRIEYSIYTTNQSMTPTTANVTEYIGDVLQYSQLVFAGGGIYDSTTKTLTWNNININGNSTDERSFVVQINSEISSTPRGANDPSAYDCVLTNSYGNTINITLPCPLIKTIESYIQQLPPLNTLSNIIYGSILILVVAYLYYRNRLLNKELRIIRKEFNEGII